MIRTKKHLVMHVVDSADYGPKLVVAEQTHRTEQFGRKKDNHEGFNPGIFFMASNGFTLISGAVPSVLRSECEGTDIEEGVFVRGDLTFADDGFIGIPSPEFLDHLVVAVTEYNKYFGTAGKTPSECPSGVLRVIE